MAEFSVRERFRYRLDEMIASGTLGIIAGLAAIMLVVVAAAAALVGATGVKGNDGRNLGYVEGFWQIMLRAFDPGVMAPDQGWELRLTSLIVTVCGLLLVSTLIGLLATTIHTHLTEVRGGRGGMAELGHTLVLGWSGKVSTIISELEDACQNGTKRSVVILAPESKALMDHVLGVRDRKGKAVRVLTRSGSAQEQADLALVNARLARSVIVLRSEEAGGDAAVVKVVLALLHDVRLPPEVPVIAEVFSRTTARALRRVIDDRVVIVEPAAVIARILAQAARMPGVNHVLQELLDFAGSEIYFSPVPPELRERSFAEALRAYPGAVPIGIRRASGQTELAPDLESYLAAGDQLIVISEDETTIDFSPLDTEVTRPTPQGVLSDGQGPEHALIIGYNDFVPLMIEEIDGYAHAGSKVTLVVDNSLGVDPLPHLPANLANLDLEVRMAPPTEEMVHDLIAERAYDYVTVVCYRGIMTEQDADSTALVTFLEVRRAARELGRECHILAEILDDRDIRLVPAESADEFIVSERLTALYMTQLSENVELSGVFADLLDAEGSEAYCVPIHHYCTPPNTHTFAELSRSAESLGHIAIGYRSSTRRNDKDNRFGVVVNPPRDEPIDLLPTDELIVLAEFV